MLEDNWDLALCFIYAGQTIMPGETLQLFLRGLEGRTHTIEIDKVIYSTYAFSKRFNSFSFDY